MKSPPLLSLSRADAGLPCSVVARGDGGDRSGEWRLERTPPVRSSPRASLRASPPEGQRAAREPGEPDADAPEELLLQADVPRESALASRALEDGEAASAEQAYQLWKERVWRFASRLGVPSEQLEDATQDVFTAVFRRWHDFRGQSTRRTWVLGFVPRIASSYRRRRRRPAEPTRESGSEGALAAVPSGDHDPFESTARLEAKRIVTHFLDGLPELDRQLFVLVELEDASVVEAAAILELGPSRAYKILDRARRALEAALVRQRAADGRRLP